MNMKRIILLALTAVIALSVNALNPETWKGLKRGLNFYMVNDLGRNGYYDQKPIAELMGEMAEEIGPECVFAVEAMCIILRECAVWRTRCG